MRRSLSCVLLITLLLTGCKSGGGAESPENLAARIRAEYLSVTAFTAQLDIHVDYGQRVQNSVFECLLDTAQCRSLQHTLCKIMDEEKDSLRFYYLGKKYESRIEHFGCKQTYLPEEPMIL